MGIACIDGLKGFEDLRGTIFPQTKVQSCVVHQICHSLKIDVASKDQKPYLPELLPVYIIATIKDLAEKPLLELTEKWGQKYPAVIKSWQDNWHKLPASLRIQTRCGVLPTPPVPLRDSILRNGRLPRSKRNVILGHFAKLQMAATIKRVRWMKNWFDVIIVGAGPAGCACAYMLRDSGLKVALLEKGSFPKDKICGDGLTLDIVQQLERMDPDLARQFESLAQKIPCYGIRVISPSNEELLIPFIKNGQRASYYLCERKVFDQFLYERCLQNKDLTVFLDTRVEEVSCAESGIAIRTNKETFSCSLVVGADGAHSVVASHLLGKTIDRRHHSAGLRRYYSNVSDLNPDNFLEIFYLKPILPGYLWIFPLPDGKANVGIGVLSSTVSNKKLDLKKMLNDFIATDPNLKMRFKNAQPLEPVKGHGLPLASRNMRRSGDRFLLLGDAASLIDPLTGEGVGNAIRSGRFAADTINDAFQLQRFDSSFLKKYDARLKRVMGSEIRLNSFVQRMFAFPPVSSFLIHRVNRSKYLTNWITDTMHSDSKSQVKTLTKVLYKLLVSP